MFFSFYRLPARVMRGRQRPAQHRARARFQHLSCVSFPLKFRTELLEKSSTFSKLGVRSGQDSYDSVGRQIKERTDNDSDNNSHNRRRNANEF